MIKTTTTLLFNQKFHEVTMYDFVRTRSYGKKKKKPVSPWKFDKTNKICVTEIRTDWAREILEIIFCNL